MFPASVEFGDALRGGEYLNTLGVFNGASESRVYALETSGDLAPWMTIVTEDGEVPVSEVEVEGFGQTRVLVKADVPEAAENGSYTGFITVLTQPTNTEGFEQAGAGVRLGAQVNVSMDVTGTQRISGEFVEASAVDVETGFPLRIVTTIANTGNVAQDVSIDVDIVNADGSPPQHLEFADTQLAPNANEQVVHEWDTTGLRPGARTGTVRVRLGQLDLGVKDLTFSVLPEGTFTRDAVLESIVLANDPAPGDLAKLVARFSNTGQIESRGKFVGELYFGDRLIESVSSEEQLVLPGGSAGIEFTARVPEEGTYRIVGKVNYEGRETEEQSASFSVGGSGSGISPLLIAAGVVAMVVALSSAMWILLRRRATAAR